MSSMPTSAPAPGPIPTVTPPPLPPHVRRTGLSASSVPQILLGLGATCLLVASVIFLAAAWSWLGIGGRTAVLVTLTVLTGAAAVVLDRRGLRIGGEALVTVSLGMLALDVVGADHAGWLDDLDVVQVVRLVGVVLLTASAGFVALQRRLVAPQVVATGALSLSIGATLVLSDHGSAVCTAGVLIGVAVGVVARLAGARVLVWGAYGNAGFWWLCLSASATFRAAQHDSLHSLWVAHHGVPMLVATVLALLPVALAPRVHAVRLAGLTTAALMATALALRPVLDEGPTDVMWATLATVVVWALVTRAVPWSYKPAPVVPLVLAALPVSVVVLRLAVAGVLNVLSVGLPFTTDAGVRLDAIGGDPRAALVVPLVAGLLIAGWAVLPREPSLRWVALAALVLAGTVNALHHPVPLWTVVAAVLAVATVLAADALRHTGDRGLVEALAALVVIAGATVLALPSVSLTAIALSALVLAAAAFLALGAFHHADLLAHVVLPLSVGLLAWIGGAAAGVDPVHRAVPAMVVLGLVAIWRPAEELEGLVAVTWAVLAGASTAYAADQDLATAVHLTVAGSLVTVTALVHESRRPLAVLGGALLTVATWVRLAGLGVHAPEPYTLPAAVLLLLVGAHHLRRHPAASTVTALLPGLSLATVPSLLWVLRLSQDPVTLRALLLGAGCLVLVLAGAGLRWSAPLWVGAVVGGTEVLRELAPYVAQTPQWVAIGLAGTVLTVVGLTWEKRLHELQGATAYLGRLR